MLSATHSRSEQFYILCGRRSSGRGRSDSVVAKLMRKQAEALSVCVCAGASRSFPVTTRNILTRLPSPARFVTLVRPPPDPYHALRPSSDSCGTAVLCPNAPHPCGVARPQHSASGHSSQFTVCCGVQQQKKTSPSFAHTSSPACHRKRRWPSAGHAPGAVPRRCLCGSAHCAEGHLLQRHSFILHRTSHPPRPAPAQPTLEERTAQDPEQRCV